MREFRLLTVCVAAATCLINGSLRADDGASTSANQKYSLSGSDWWIVADPGPSGTRREPFGAAPSSPEWTPATVPGNVQADLEAAHLLTPLWYGVGDLRVHDVPHRDWWYRRDFTLPASFSGKRVALIFDGVDHECEVWLNGRRIGGNAGMFRQFSFDVADMLLPGRTNRLAVRIAKMPPGLAPFFERSAENRMYDGLFFEGLKQMMFQLKELKSPTSLAWDWGTNIWSLGIWKDVRLVATGPARIENVRVQCSLSDSYSKATIAATLDVDSLDARPVRATFRISGNGQEAAVTSDASLVKGRNVVKVDIPLDKPALWWPNGQGDQPLYTLRTEIAPADGGPASDARSTRFGVREVQWVHTENAPADFVSRYQLVINGRPVRTMGSNLIPPDLLFGRALPRAMHLLHRAKAAGMNTLRQWGGGVPLANEFYDLADELGIMISFEFPFANAPPPTDAVFLGNVEATARNILRQVRNHPSIIEYSGGNEMPWTSLDQHPVLLLLRRIVAEEDGRLFRATCPDLGAKHGPWVFFVDEASTEYNALHYNGMETMRAGEFGTVSPANLEVWHRDVPPKSRAAINRTDDPVLVHKNAVQGAGRPQDWLGKPYIDGLFNTRDDLAQMVEAGQFIGADGLRYAIDALRRKGKRLGGLTTWDFNEPWTNTAGSYLVDYDGRPLMNYDFVRQALAPVSLSLCYNSILYEPKKGIHAELFLTSDAPQSVAKLRWKWLARDRRGTVIARGNGDASVEPREVKSLARLDIRPPKLRAFGPFFIELRLEDSNGQSLGERIYAFGMAGVPSPLAGMLNNKKADVDDGASELNTADRSADNLAYVGNGAKRATASSARTEPYHQPPAINDGKYGNESGWIGAHPKSWFQIDLGKPAKVDEFKLGRDRTGVHTDRAVDYLKIESSLDGRSWRTIFDKAGLATLNTDVAKKTMAIRVTPVQTQFLKVTVDSQNPDSGVFPCVDEFEAYLSTDPPPAELPQVAFEYAKPEVFRPVRRTSITVTPTPSRREGDQEVLELVVKNTGAMTALFCEPHPLIGYRTDLFIDNNHCFIPPGECRTIAIRALNSPRPLPGESQGVRAAGLSLVQTGWRISCWNADDVVIEPSDDVLLAVGRRDAMCREFQGYAAASQAPPEGSATLIGTRPDAASLPSIVTKRSSAGFKFNVDADRAGRKATLRLHTSDQASDVASEVEILVNGRRFAVTLPKGLGIQQSEPAHLAFPSTVGIELPPGTLVSGGNVMNVRLTNPGWFTWDAMDLRTDSPTP